MFPLPSLQNTLACSEKTFAQNLQMILRRQLHMNKLMSLYCVTYLVFSNWYRAILCLCFINECFHNILIFRVSVTLPE